MPQMCSVPTDCAAAELYHWVRSNYPDSTTLGQESERADSNICAAASTQIIPHTSTAHNCLYYGVPNPFRMLYVVVIHQVRVKCSRVGCERVHGLGAIAVHLKRRSMSCCSNMQEFFAVLPHCRVLGSFLVFSYCVDFFGHPQPPKQGT